MIILQFIIIIEIILDAFIKSYSYELNDILHYILLFLQMYFIFVKFRYHQYITYIYDDGSETDFSWVYCCQFKERTNIDDLLRAMRNAIKYDIIKPFSFIQKGLPTKFHVVF